MPNESPKIAAYAVLPTGPLKDGGQVWAWEAWAVGPRSQAVKIHVMRDHEATATESQELKTQASGLYRRQYHQWCVGMDFAQHYMGGAPAQATLGG